MPPWLAQQHNPAMNPHTEGKEQAPVTQKKTSVKKNPTSLGGGREGKKMADRTQHEGKTERAKESHDRCSQPPGMRMPKTADLGTQALLVVNSFKLHLNAFNNCIAKMEVGCLKYPGASTIGSQPLDWNNAPMTGTTAQPSHEPPHQAEGTSEPWR